MNREPNCKLNGHGFNSDGICVYCHTDDGSQTKQEDTLTNPPKDKEHTPKSMNTEDYREQIAKALKEVHRQGLHEDSGNGEPCYCMVEPAILSLIESEKFKARIEELELVGKALNDDPELIRVWATHRIKELESKEEANSKESIQSSANTIQKDTESIQYPKYLTAEGMRAYDGSKWV